MIFINLRCHKYAKTVQMRAITIFKALPMNHALFTLQISALHPYTYNYARSSLLE